MYETMGESVKALRTGKVDALLNTSYVWNYVMQKPPYANLELQPSAMIYMDFRAGTPDTPAGREIISRLNKGIDKLSDTQRQTIILDYTTRHLYQYNISDYIYKYGLICLLVAVLFVALLVINAQKRRALILEQEEKMRRLIDHDPLTGLLSLSGFRKRVKKTSGFQFRYSIFPFL